MAVRYTNKILLFPKSQITLNDQGMKLLSNYVRCRRLTKGTDHLLFAIHVAFITKTIWSGLARSSKCGKILEVLAYYAHGKSSKPKQLQGVFTCM